MFFCHSLLGEHPDVGSQYPSTQNIEPIKRVCESPQVHVPPYMCLRDVSVRLSARGILVRITRIYRMRVPVRYHGDASLDDAALDEKHELRSKSDLT